MTTREIRDLTVAELDEVSAGNILPGLILWFVGSAAWDCLKGECVLPNIRTAPSHGEFTGKI
jgi:hypothetical protein